MRGHLACLALDRPNPRPPDVTWCHQAYYGLRQLAGNGRWYCAYCVTGTATYPRFRTASSTVRRRVCVCVYVGGVHNTGRNDVRIPWRGMMMHDGRAGVGQMCKACVPTSSDNPRSLRTALSPQASGSDSPSLFPPPLSLSDPSLFGFLSLSLSPSRPA